MSLGHRVARVSNAGNYNGTHTGPRADAVLFARVCISTPGGCGLNVVFCTKMAPKSKLGLGLIRENWVTGSVL